LYFLESNDVDDAILVDTRHHQLSASLMLPRGSVVLLLWRSYIVGKQLTVEGEPDLPSPWQVVA
jgi:hypothetical protein